MKKQLLGLMTILAVLGACQKNEVTSLSEDVTIHATIENEDATKTVMDENNNILWSENDQIIAFMKSSYGHKYQVKPSFVGKSYAEFSLVSSGDSNDLFAGNEWDHNVVYYPYSENIECLKSGANYALEVNLPSEQVYVPDSFANGSMAMIAVSESNNITFKNVLGGIKLQLKGTQKVKSIKIEGKNSEKLSGAATVTAYTDETKPAITMASGASTSVTLNCGEGVQLNESTATEFIISLPPVLFSQGFTVTVADTESNTYTVETDKANTVLRSSILTMPAFKLGEAPDSDSDATYIEHIFLDKTSLTMYPETSYILVVDIDPIDVNYPTLQWSSADNTIATVDQNGKITAISDGTTTITAIAVGGASASCNITVKSALPITVKNYVVDDVDYGQGINVGGIVWAPVNCGYEPANGDYKGYPYGKLYQWGRLYGQGYDERDATYPSGDDFVTGPVPPSWGSLESYSKIFFVGSKDWCNNRVDDKWSKEGAKTSNDPCPSGWRVPTSDELSMLCKNYYYTDRGCYFTGEYTYMDSISQVFFNAVGCRDADGYSNGVGLAAFWSSSVSGDDACALEFNLGKPMLNRYKRRAYGYHVRCVQE